MKKIKNIICYTLTATMLSTMTSCSFNSIKEEIYSKVNKVGKKVHDFVENVQNDINETPTSDLIVEGLENKDASALKKLFSVEAQNICADLDKRIDYMIEMYKGKYIETSYYNYSMTANYGVDEWRLISPVCVIVTTEKCYRLNWEQWTACKENKNKVGIYGLCMEEVPDKDSNDGSRQVHIAGIITPDISQEHYTLSNLWRIIYHREVSKTKYKDFRELLSDNFLETGITDDDIEDFLVYCNGPM